MQDNEDIKTFSSGAQSSSSKAGYWMVPFCVLRAIAQRFDLGAKKYDAHNWKRGCNDPEFMRDRFNHMIEHAFKFLEGGDEEDDIEGSIVAVLINAVFLTYWTIMHRTAVMAAFPTEAPDVLQAKAPLTIRPANPNALSPRPLESTTSIAGISPELQAAADNADLQLMGEPPRPVQPVAPGQPIQIPPSPLKQHRSAVVPERC